MKAYYYVASTVQKSLGPGADPFTGCAWTPSTVAAAVAAGRDATFNVAGAGRDPPPQRPGPLPFWENVEMCSMGLDRAHEMEATVVESLGPWGVRSLAGIINYRHDLLAMNRVSALLTYKII